MSMGPEVEEVRMSGVEESRVKGLKWSGLGVRCWMELEANVSTPSMYGDSHFEN